MEDKRETGRIVGFHLPLSPFAFLSWVAYLGISFRVPRLWLSVLVVAGSHVWSCLCRLFSWCVAGRMLSGRLLDILCVHVTEIHVE